MKNLMFFIIAMVSFSFFAINTSAQGVYIKAGAGYHFATATGNLGGFNNYTSSSGSSATIEQVNVSFGKGIDFGGTFGYMFNENVGAEFGVSYLLGSKSKAKDIYTGGTTECEYSAKMLRLNPAIVIAAGGENINPYAKFGLIMGFGDILYTMEDNDQGDIYIGKWKYNGGLAFGFSAGLGANFSLNDVISLFAEVNMINMSYAPTKGEVTEATYNGVDELPNMTTSEKEIEFVDKYTYDYNNPPSDSQPRQELKIKHPFSSIGVNVGIFIGL